MHPKTVELARDILEEQARAKYGACQRCDGALNDTEDCPACGEHPLPPGYQRRGRGLRLLHAIVGSDGTRYRDKDLDPTSAADIALAREVLADLYSESIGAGSNTYRRSFKRYEDAKRRYAAIKNLW